MSAKKVATVLDLLLVVVVVVNDKLHVFIGLRFAVQSARERERRRREGLAYSVEKRRARTEVWECRKELN